MYWRHSLPTGCIPAPVGPDGKRGINGWQFYYKGWTGTSTPGLTRLHATPDNLFSNNCLSELDVDMLKRMGMSKKRIADLDALFFY